VPEGMKAEPPGDPSHFSPWVHFSQRGRRQSEEWSYSRPSGGKFEGRVEEVDSGRNLKFGSIEEFLQFWQGCLDDQQRPED